MPSLISDWPPMPRAVRRTHVAEWGHTPGDDWRHAAKCKDMDPELFFLDDYAATGARRQVRELAAVCGACPVKFDCLQWALDHRADHGVWGGLTPRQREKLPRRSHRGRAIIAV